jgi:hypothetical protein
MIEEEIKGEFGSAPKSSGSRTLTSIGIVSLKILDLPIFAEFVTIPGCIPNLPCSRWRAPATGKPESEKIRAIFFPDPEMNLQPT